MKKSFYLLSGCLLILLISSNVFAVNLYLDSNPNVNGPATAFDAWKAATYAGIIDGSFVSMANGINPDNIGTTDFEIQDVMAYSFGDTGRNLGWVYQIEGETAASMADHDFKISLSSHWDIGWDIDFLVDSAPESYYEYDADGDEVIDGVLGYACYGYWGAYGVDTQEALDQDYADYGALGEHMTFTATLDGIDTTLVANRAPAPVPEPATFLLLGSGLAGLAFYRRKKK